MGFESEEGVGLGSKNAGVDWALGKSIVCGGEKGEPRRHGASSPLLLSLPPTLLQNASSTRSAPACARRTLLHRQPHPETAHRFAASCSATLRTNTTVSIQAPRTLAKEQNTRQKLMEVSEHLSESYHRWRKSGDGNGRITNQALRAPSLGGGRQGEYVAVEMWHRW